MRMMVDGEDDVLENLSLNKNRFHNTCSTIINQ